MQNTCTTLYFHQRPVRLHLIFTCDSDIINGMIFGGGGLILYRMGVLIFCTIFPKYFSFYEALSDILLQIGMYLHVQFRSLFDFNESKIFLIFSKNNQTLSFMIIRLVKVQLFHEDRQTERRTEDSWTGRETDRQT
jgi:hypothetical protein